MKDEWARYERQRAKFRLKMARQRARKSGKTQMPPGVTFAPIFFSHPQRAHDLSNPLDGVY